MKTKTKTNKNTKLQQYACISCLYPTNTLYRQYSTKYNIKLHTCQQCFKDVDTYIEHELLLVIMDIVLFRKFAYRHLLFNRSLMMVNGYNGNGNGNDDSNCNDEST